MSSLLNARKFVSQIPAISEDNKLVTPEDMPNVSSFASEFSVGSEKDSTHPYLFAPERSSRDLSYKATSFEFRPPISSSTSGLSLDLPVLSEQSDDSTELDANPLIESTEEHESTPQLVVDFRFPMKEYLELVCALKPKSTEQISSPESASVPIIKDLQNQESLASLPQSASKCLAKCTPMFFTSTPKSEAPFIKQNVPHLPLSFSATISSIDIVPVTTLSTKESSPSVEQPDSPTSDAKDSAKHLQFHESSVQPLSNLTSPPSCRQPLSNASSIIQDQLTTSSSDIYYTAKLPTSSRDLRNACFVPGRIAKNIPITVTPVAPPRSVRRLQLIAIPQTNYPFCNVESTLWSSDSASGEGSPSWRLTTPASFSTGDELQLHGEFSSDTSASSEEVDKTFMRESKNYIDYAIEYKGFLEQAFNYVKATPFLVRSLRSTDDFRYLLRKHECIIELYNIPKTCNTFDILRIYYEEPRCLIWCDSSHARLTTQSVSQGMYLFPTISITISCTTSIWLQLLFCWGFAFATLLPPLIGVWGQLGLSPSTFSCTILEKNGSSPKKAIFLFGFVLPCLVIIISYSCIYWRVRRSRMKLKLHERQRVQEQRSRRERDDSRLTKLMLLIFICFLICILPLMLMNVLDDDVRYPTFHVIASIFAWASSAINPIIYAASNRQYRTAYSQLFNVVKSSLVFSDSKQNSIKNHTGDMGGEVSNHNNCSNIKVI